MIQQMLVLLLLLKNCNLTPRNLISLVISYAYKVKVQDKFLIILRLVV
jgi:hypothetical protein